MTCDQHSEITAGTPSPTRMQQLRHIAETYPCDAKTLVTVQEVRMFINLIDAIHTMNSRAVSELLGEMK